MKFIIALVLALGIIYTLSAQTVYYNNPILAGFYPDPSICRNGEDYYLTTSSFAYFPGLPIFHSKDLVNWKQIGHAIHRTEQLDFNGSGVSRGLFAPAIRYYKGKFYIICTFVDKLGNFIITATDPAGPWSVPLPLPELNGIDPSLYFENEKVYVVFNSIPPDNISDYDGHRTIRMFELDANTLKVKGDEIILVNGGTDISKKPVWIEAPHIFKKENWYYLFCAEGGTAYNHSEVVFRSENVKGPYLPYANNPILTQRHLDKTRPDPVTTAGHADFTQTPDGRWYAVFLACRPYEGDHYNTGRETFMLPVTWKNGWPHILEGEETISYSNPVPLPGLTSRVENMFSGNFTYKDNFENVSLDHRWIFLRTPIEKWYSMTEPKGKLSMNLRPETVSGKSNPSFIGHRQQHMTGSVSVSLSFQTKKENEKAGLIIFQNEEHYYYLCRSVNKAGEQIIELFKGAGNEKKGELPESLASAPLTGDTTEINLKIQFDKAEYSFYYSTQKDNWKLLKDKVEGRFLSTATAKGFVGSVFGLYATSSGSASKNKAYYSSFEYTGRDEVYR
jgi:xylan 1,4-beta-xylosidase